MVRRRRLLAQVALAGASIVLLAFPSNGSALRAVNIGLTASGPSPAVMTIPAGLYPVWINSDTVTHTVTFADGGCTLQIAPGTDAACNGYDFFRVGSYPYTVDGTLQASVVVVPEGRSVTLTAKSHRTLRHNRVLTLRGKVTVPLLSPPAPPAAQPVVVLARHGRNHPFRRVATVSAKTHGWTLVWHLRVRPRARTTYMAEANSQPSGGQFWERARSRPFEVRVRR